MYYAAEHADFSALAELFVDSFGGTREFAMHVLERFAGPGNVFAAKRDNACAALLCVVPVMLKGMPGAYYYGLTTRPDERGKGTMTALMEFAERELKGRGARFAALIPASADLFGFYEKRGFEKAFGKRIVPRSVRNNLWAQAEFDTVTAHGLQALRRQYVPMAVELNAEGCRMMLTDLYSLGVTSVSSEQGYGLFFQKGDRLRFVELFATDDRAAQTLLEAARQKTGAAQVQLELGAEQSLFQGEGVPRDYGMIRFFDQQFDVSDSYMRLMLDDE